MLAEKLAAISSEDEVEYHDYISSNDDGKIVEIVPAPDIHDEEVEVYQIFTEQTLATNETRQMIFASKNKTEKRTSNPHSEKDETLQNQWDNKVC